MPQFVDTQEFQKELSAIKNKERKTVDRFLIKLYLKYSQLQKENEIKKLEM